MAADERDWASDRARMVETQLRAQGIADPRVLAAMGEVPRELFVPLSARSRAYDDTALPIGEGQTISQPFMVARALELMALEGSERALEVGAGSGYQAAVLGRLAKEVVALEIVPSLAEGARKALAMAGVSNVSVVAIDGSVGCPAEAPFDRIVVAAGAPVVPRALIDQLAPGGRLVIPVGPRSLQRLRVVRKLEDGRVVESDHEACLFVPLVGEEGWPDALH